MRVKPKRAKDDLIKIPMDFYEFHKVVALTVAIIFVNRIAFVVTFSQSSRLLMANYLSSHTTIQIGESLMNIVKLYDRGGLIVKLIMMDMELKKS